MLRASQCRARRTIDVSYALVIALLFCIKCVINSLKLGINAIFAGKCCTYN
jgi:hypothetical protein